VWTEFMAFGHREFDIRRSQPRCGGPCVIFQF
jgi:hypothetical protein